MFLLSSNQGQRGVNQRERERDADRNQLFLNSSPRSVWEPESEREMSEVAHYFTCFDWLEFNLMTAPDQAVPPVVRSHRTQ